MKKGIFYFIFSIFLIIFALPSYSADTTPLDVVEKVEKNLIYSKEVLKQDKADDIVVKKGGWTQEDTKAIENQHFKKKKINANVKKTKEDKTLIALKRKAFDAINVGQYEIAAQLYKNVLQIDKNDIYATLGLATAYQYLGQYVQAKPLYLKVLEAFPTDQQVMANLLAIITDETPYEAVYLLSNIADKNTTSPLIQAQASIAYSKIKNYKKAIDYIKRAIELDQNNLEYKYNLAVLYDLDKDYNQARFLYNELLVFYSSNPESNYNLPLNEIQDRVNTLQQNNKRKK